MPKAPLPARPMPRATAQGSRPMRTAWGHELAVRFLLAYGGAELYLAADPKGRSSAEALVGPEAVARMADHYQLGQRVRVPLARQWLARMLHWQDNSTAEAARTIRASDVSVRAWIKRGWG